MSQSVDIRRTYKYRLYRSKRDFRLRDTINVSGIMKKVGSINQKEGQRHIARRHIRIADKRRDFHFQLAHDLCDYYDILIFEDLNLQGMKALWGRKVSDLGFAQFLKTLEWVAFKRGKQVVFLDRFERTTGKCWGCGHEQSVTLAERTFVCVHCGLSLDRDHNAALNMLEAGRRLILSQPEAVPVTNAASGVHGSFSHP